MKSPLITTFLLIPAVLNAEALAIIDLDHTPEPGETLVWSPLFQESWTKLQSLKAGPFLSVEPENQLIHKLNNFRWDKEKVMPHTGYDIYAGSNTPEFTAQTAKAIFEKYQISIPTDRSPDTPNGHAVYSIMLRDLMFKTPFFRSQQIPLLFKSSNNQSHEVSFFGTTRDLSSRYSNNVKVLKYTNDESSFIISIRTNTPDERLLIYLPTKPETMRQAIDTTLKAINTPLKGEARSKNDPAIHSQDTIKIPYVKIDSDTRFENQLQGVMFYDNEPAPFTITAACQITRFELFEKGARIEVQTNSIDAPFGGTPEPQTSIPRSFICDRPFFIFVWKDQAELPYFATWIDNINALQTLKKRPKNRNGLDHP